MYAEFYGLATRPFQLTPDARFFFESTVHRQAMAYWSTVCTTPKASS